MGRCCRLRDPETKLPGKKRCKFLKKIGERYICRIYRTRLGKKLDDETFCDDRENIELNYEGCPFNVEERKMIPDKQIF